jgi:transposase-like protein
MSIVILQAAEVKVCKDERPSKCHYCEGETFQRWGGAIRKVKDPQIKEVLVYRYRCCSCKRTFRDYPTGVSHNQQTERMRSIVAIGWVLGLSYRGIASLYAAFGVSISRMTAWRDVQEYAHQYLSKWKQQDTRVVGVDGAYVLGWKKKQSVLVVVDLGTGEPITVGYVNEKDPRAVKKFLQPLVQQLGISVIVTDDLHTYKQVADKLQLEHQICQFHVRRWVGLALHELDESLAEEWCWMLAEVRQIITELRPEGDKRLIALYRKLPSSQMGRSGAEYSALDKLRYLIIRLAENWARFRVFDWQPDVPWTNNPTEQVIGRMKMRARTVRGYKTWAGMKSGLIAAGRSIS